MPECPTNPLNLTSSILLLLYGGRSTVLVNRGWFPRKRVEGISYARGGLCSGTSTGAVTVVGVLRPGEEVHPRCSMSMFALGFSAPETFVVMSACFFFCFA